MTADKSPGRLAQIACVLEATARKPGNVHRFRDFEDASYLDFILSALAIAPAMDLAPSRGVGGTVLDAVKATRKVVSTNTNFGIILLLAPLCATRPGGSFRDSLRETLETTTIDDARLVYEGARVASPGGLGEVGDQDVARPPTITLVEAMRLAADRDGVARQYANGYFEVFDLVVPAIEDAARESRPVEQAIILATLRLMSRLPDTLISRKQGPAESLESAERAAAVLKAGWPDEPGANGLLQDLDAWLRGVGHARNPGTTADIVTAGLFVALGNGTIRLPFAAEGGPGWAAGPAGPIAS